ncbi:dihydrouridine synthase 3-like protein, isoform CRA_d [Mycena amicta]|nr:dihydrouridine synthase 3-like protein, isoform CRA_d [Mycena amicta]
MATVSAGHRAHAVRAREAEEDLPRIPIFGNGDCYSGTAYWETVDHSGVDGVMNVESGTSARASSWRVFGSMPSMGYHTLAPTTAGVKRHPALPLANRFPSNTATVLLGILERLPAKLNERPPAFRGRDELETLLASGDSRDWVRISEMFLGPAPETWGFTPKHKSNVYESQG